MKYINTIVSKVIFMIIIIIGGILLLQNTQHNHDHLEDSHHHEIANNSMNDDCDCCDYETDNHKNCDNKECSCGHCYGSINVIISEKYILGYTYKIIGKIYISNIIGPNDIYFKLN